MSSEIICKMGPWNRTKSRMAVEGFKGTAKLWPTDSTSQCDTGQQLNGFEW